MRRSISSAEIEQIKTTGKEVHVASGSTWNDGGSWNTWVYKMKDGTYLRIHQPSDYRNYYEVAEVRPRTSVKVRYVEVLQ